MDILKRSQKCNGMNILERFYVYKTAKYKPIMDLQFVMYSNILFDLAVDKDKDRM
jgi:hypothetical protein